MRNGNGRLVQYKDYVAGWLDSSIPDFLELLGRPPADMAYALITWLDSIPGPASLLSACPELRPLSRAAWAVGDAILVRTEPLLDTNSKSPIFFGFDEVWFFPTADIEPKPDAASLVGPKRITQLKMRKLGRWMTKNNCSLGLGDGGGLNMIVKAGGTAKHLIGHSLTQRQHAMSAEVE
jgi:hypothetical protein